MATKKFYHDIDLVNVGQLIGARIQNVTTSEKTTLGNTLGTAHKGLQVWDTDLDAPFIWSGTAWLRDSLEVSGDIVYKGSINPTNADSVEKVSGYQYVVDTAGTLTATGVTFSPSGVVEVGDVVLFTDATTATVLQRNNEQATEASLGIVELATQVEVDAGTDAVRVITPATLAGSQLASDVSTNATDIGNLETFTGSGTALTTTATDLAGAINEHETQINTNASNISTNTGNISTNATDIDNLETYTGYNTALDTTATSLAGAVNEIHGEVNTNATDIGNLETFAGSGTTLDTTATSLAGAVNELHGEINTNTTNVSTNATDIDNLETYTGYNTALTTTATSLAGAVNELDVEIGDVSTLATTATSVVGAINEVHGLLPKTYFAGNVSLTADTAVTVTHNLALTDKDSFTFRIADSTGSTVSVDVDSVDVNSLTITSGVALTGIKVTIIGF